MGIINKALYKITEEMPCRLIPLDSGPYLERYYAGRVAGYAFYLHRFVSCDSERHLHNHPFSAVSIVLAGGYTESVAVDFGPKEMLTESSKITWFNRIASNTFHRIIDVKPMTWTLFIHGPRKMIDCGMAGKPKSWGFIDGLTFNPMPPTPSKWWLDMPKGRHSKREPL